MARLKAKKQWDETMAASGIITKSNAKTRRKRVSGWVLRLDFRTTIVLTTGNIPV